jgi:hypothetical protein
MCLYYGQTLYRAIPKTQVFGNGFGKSGQKFAFLLNPRLLSQKLKFWKSLYKKAGYDLNTGAGQSTASSPYANHGKI